MDQPPKSPSLLPVLLVSLLLNGYFLWTWTATRSGAIAQAGGQKFTRVQLSAADRTRLNSFNFQTTFILRQAAEAWAEKIVLPKEAASRSVTIEVLLKSEVYDKIKITDEDVYQRYVRSPEADESPWPDVLKAIRAEIMLERGAQMKRDYIRSLYSKYGVKLNLPASPIAFYPNTDIRRFKTYTAPRLADVSQAGRVVGPPSLGPMAAPVTLEVFSDFLCPYSHMFFKPLQELHQKYPQQLRILFRHTPMPMHEGSSLMHEASVCAQEQGKFWEYYDRLMGGDPQKKDMGELILLAKEMGLDTARFAGCLQTKKYSKWVEMDLQTAKLQGARGTPSFLINGRLGMGAQSADSVSRLIDWYLHPKGVYPVILPKDKTAPGAPSGPDPAKVYELDKDWLESGPSVGPKDGNIVLVEFVDYNCPFCQKAAKTVDELMKRHAGKVRYFPKNNPLSMHPNAMKTAQAALCAQAQGKYEAYVREVFGDSWGKNSPEDLKAIAGKAGLKRADFDACLDGDKTKALVEKDMAMAAQLDANSTPIFFINGRAVIGAVPLENFEKALEAPSVPQAPASKPEKSTKPTDVVQPFYA